MKRPKKYYDQLEKEIIISKGSIKLLTIMKNDAIKDKKILAEYNLKLIKELVTLKDALRKILREIIPEWLANKLKELIKNDLSN